MQAQAPSYPGAVPPERIRALQRGPLRLQLSEWGDPQGEPLVLCHGMWDHARGFDVLAPLLAERYRVVAIDARGHGESSWADSYRWSDDLCDLGYVLQSLERPCHLIGHSKGGGQATDLACYLPGLVRKLVNIDGFGPPKEMPRRPGEPETLPEQAAQFLDRRRDNRPHRPAADLDELSARRGRTNTRLSPDWLRYFVFHAARRVDGQWTWKSDPYLGQGFGPWSPDWIATLWKQVRAPMLAVSGTEPDVFGPAPDELLDERLADVREVERARVAGTGHFVHMEKPRETARLILDFLSA